jgi:hypothetical protein
VFETVLESANLPENLKLSAQQIAMEIRARNQWKSNTIVKLSNNELLVLHEQFLNHWINYLQLKKQLFLGKISKILHSGFNGDGFIEYEHKSYYFKTKSILNSTKKTEIAAQDMCYFVAQSNHYNGKRRDSAIWLILVSQNKVVWPQNKFQLNK